MKKALLSALIAAPLAFAAGRASSTVSEKTQKNLDTAMHGEAFAYSKYLLFAEQARKNGHPEIARLYEDTAKTERLEHLKEEAQLSGLVGTDAENLRKTIEGENYEYTTMYPTFAREAEQAGDTEAAKRFREIANDELKHRDAFQAALDKLEQKTPASGRSSPQKR